jgi:hypothetical protein
MLEDRDNELCNMVYNTQYPINIVINAVDNYVDFSNLGHQPLLESQMFAKAYVILNKTRRFKNDITDWNRCPEAEKTWVNFKDHFYRAHQEFRETTDVTLKDSELQRNNANLVQQELLMACSKPWLQRPTLMTLELPKRNSNYTPNSNKCKNQ